MWLHNSRDNLMKSNLQNCARSKFFTGNRIKKFGVETLERNSRVWGTLSTHELFDLMLSPVHLPLVRKKSGIFLVIGEGGLLSALKSPARM